MERKVGEVFEFNGIKLKVKRTNNPVCDGCYFERFDCVFWQTNRIEETGRCYSDIRRDKNDVIFVKVEDSKDKED